MPSSPPSRTLIIPTSFHLREHREPAPSWLAMNTHTVMESSIFIAWDYLERADELGNPEVARQILSHTIEGMMHKGESRPLMLSSEAINAYLNYRHRLTLAF
jgi:hypothetical protein